MNIFKKKHSHAHGVKCDCDKNRFFQKNSQEFHIIPCIKFYKEIFRGTLIKGKRYNNGYTDTIFVIKFLNIKFEYKKHKKLNIN
jgi:hypothetical protein